MFMVPFYSPLQSSEKNLQLMICHCEDHSIFDEKSYLHTDTYVVILSVFIFHTWVFLWKKFVFSQNVNCEK